jgi:hypothetical protein
MLRTKVIINNPSCFASVFHKYFHTLFVRSQTASHFCHLHQNLATLKIMYKKQFFSFGLRAEFGQKEPETGRCDQKVYGLANPNFG